MERKLAYLINATEEDAIFINSALRNSGINIHIKTLESTSALERCLDENIPVLLLYRVVDKQSVSLADVLRLAGQYNVLLALQISPADHAIVASALAHSSVHVLNLDSEEQLINLVRKQVGVSADKKGHSQLESLVTELEQRNQLLLEGSEEAIAYQHEGLHISANRAYQQMMGVSDPSELKTISLLELVKGKDVDIKSLLRDMAAGNFPDNPVAATIKTTNGTEFEAEMFLSPVRLKGEDCVQVRVRQRDEGGRLKGELEKLKGADPVTHLANRRVFIEELQSFLDRCQQEGIKGSLLYLEPDDIDSLSKSMGFTAFGEFITDFAALLRQNTSPQDVATQLGECGFAILVTENASQRPQAIFEGLSKSLSETEYETANKAYAISCSAGIAPIASQSRGVDEVLAQAHSAYASAAVEGNALRRFEPAQLELSTSVGDDHWAERIRHALNSDAFYSVQGAIVNLEGESEGLFENRIFLREEQGDLQSNEFLPHAEQHDLGSAIDRLIIPGLLKSISGSGDRHILALSANSVLDFSFSSWFQHQIQELGVQGSQLIIQVPVVVALANLRQCQRLVSELEPAGVRFSLSEFDDQNRGCKLLGKIDVNLVKLRSGLSESLNNNTAHQAIVRNVVKAAETAGAMVVADDVRDAADMAALWQCGVKLVCGDFLKDPSQITG